MHISYFYLFFWRDQLSLSHYLHLISSSYISQVLPQYFLSAAFCLDRGSLGVPSMAAAVTSALVVILTPAHIIVMVSLCYVH